MQLTLPGTTIEVSAYREDIANDVLSHIFSAGGVVLSQISVMTGLEPYTVQNWVKRGFLAPPTKRQYSRRQFTRVVIINMLKETLQIDQIVKLLSYINGELSTESDDLIDDTQLYTIFVNLIGLLERGYSDEKTLSDACDKILCNYKETVVGSRARVKRVLIAMYFAYIGTEARQKSAELIRALE